MVSVKWCSVALSEVAARGGRLEAGAFDVEARQAQERLRSCPFPLTTIGGEAGLTSSYVCRRFKRIWVKRSEYPIYQPSSIVDVRPLPDGYISEKTNADIDALRVRRGQLLLTCSGTVGSVTVVSRTLDNAIFSHDLLRIECRSPADVGYVYAYLKSALGSRMLLTNKYGAMVTHIEAEHLDSVPIPAPPEAVKSRINELVMQSYELRDESNELTDRAQELLAKELELPLFGDIQAETDGLQTFSVRLSGLAGRADASYHSPLADRIAELLRAGAAEVTRVGDRRVSRAVVLAGVFKRTYVAEEYGYPFLGGKEITQLSPKTEKFLSRAIHRERYERELKVTENTVLVSGRGTIGAVALVPKHWENYAVSQNVLKIVPASSDIAGYLYIFLSSEYGRELIRRQVYGSVVDMIDAHCLESVELPLLKNSDVQRQINALALEANDKRYRAHLLEQEAMRVLDEEVLSAGQ